MRHRYASEVMQAEEPTGRPTMATALQHRFFATSPLVHVRSYLESMTVHAEADKAAFFGSLHERLAELQPDEV